MKNILYVGNALSNKGKTSTTIEILGNHLKEFCKIKIASNKSNKFLRLIDMMRLIVVNQSKTDYVLIDTYSTQNFYYAFIVSQLCRFFRVKYIPILHGGNLENRLKNNKRLSRLIFKNAYKLVAPSLFLKSVFNKYEYDDVLYIPNYIEIEKYKYSQRDIEIIKLLWVRSFSSIYNPNQAILVLEALLKKSHKAMLTMVGPDVDGSLVKAKELALMKGLEVKFTGNLSKKEWIELSDGYNIFINTTNFDNTPVSVIEAMALGLPIVSTNVGGLPFLIENGSEGLLVPPEHVKAMVDEILKLKTDKSLVIELTNNARRRVEQYDWNVVKSKWESLLS